MLPFSKSAIFTFVSLLLFAEVGAQPTPIDRFHSATISKGGKSAQAISPDVVNSANPHVKPFAAIVQATIWQQSGIPVCWENAKDVDAEAMNWTRDAIAKTWEKETKLRFTGWQKCGPINKGIRIQILDAGPHVKFLGRQLDGLTNGMVLNFTFQNWSNSCFANREHCIRAIAVHEFGHAMGFTHEQNRADAPGECRSLAQATDPDKVLTPYDKDSVMNYCNKKWNNDGYLSALDIEAGQTLYGKP